MSLSTILKIVISSSAKVERVCSVECLGLLDKGVGRKSSREQCWWNG